MKNAIPFFISWFTKFLHKRGVLGWLRRHRHALSNTWSISYNPAAHHHGRLRLFYCLLFLQSKRETLTNPYLPNRGRNFRSCMLYQNKEILEFVSNRLQMWKIGIFKKVPLCGAYFSYREKDGVSYARKLAWNVYLIRNWNAIIILWTSITMWSKYGNICVCRFGQLIGNSITSCNPHSSMLYCGYI